MEGLKSDSDVTTDSFIVLQNIRYNMINNVLLQRYATVRNDGDDIVFNMKLPPHSMEAFKKFADDPGPFGEDTVHKYLMRVVGPGMYKDPYPELHGGILGKTYLAEPLEVKCKEEEKRENKLVVIRDGRMELEFDVAEDVLLFCEINHKSMKPEILKNAVQELVSGNQHSYVIDLPEKGEYGINIYARYFDDSDRIYHGYTCMADYDTENQEFSDEVEYDAVKLETLEEETNIR